MFQGRCSFGCFRGSPGRQAETFMRADLKEIIRVLSFRDVFQSILQLRGGSSCLGHSGRSLSNLFLKEKPGREIV